MQAKVGMFHPEKDGACFEGIAFLERMTDKKLGAFCKSGEWFLVAGACSFHGEARDLVALGRLEGESYSVLNRVPMPFFVFPSPGIRGKSSVVARNIVNRLSRCIGKDEDVFLQEYLMEQERYGISYVSG